MDCTHKAYRDAVQTCDLVWVSLYRTKLSTASSATFFIHIVFLYSVPSAYRDAVQHY